MNEHQNGAGPPLRDAEKFVAISCKLDNLDKITAIHAERVKALNGRANGHDERLKTIETREGATADRTDTLIRDVRTWYVEAAKVEGIVLRHDADLLANRAAQAALALAVAELTARLNKTAEDTSKHGVELTEVKVKELASKDAKIAANKAAEIRRVAAITSLLIGLAILALGGVGTMFWFLVIHSW